MKHIAFSLALLAASALSAVAQTPNPSRIQIAQGGSCSAWKATCEGRCADAACRKNNCGPKMSACLSSGCWTEGAAYGGGRTCGLAKN